MAFSEIQSIENPPILIDVNAHLDDQHSQKKNIVFNTLVHPVVT